MAAVALAVIGKNNEPLYIKTFLDEDDPSEEELFGLPTTKTQKSLRQQFILHSALDRFEKISGPYPGCAWREHHPGITGNDAMFVGLLCPVEDLRVYGRYCKCANVECYVQRKSCLYRIPSVVASCSHVNVGILLGYMTTTQVKFLLTVQDEATMSDQKTMDETLKQLFIKLHRQYVEYSLNPFSSMTGPIVSSRFDQQISERIAAYNRALS